MLILVNSHSLCELYGKFISISRLIPSFIHIYVIAGVSYCLRSLKALTICLTIIAVVRNKYEKVNRNFIAYAASKIVGCILGIWRKIFRALALVNKITYVGICLQGPRYNNKCNKSGNCFLLTIKMFVSKRYIL